MDESFENNGRDYYYRVLGVNRLASQHEITEAYERLIYSSPQPHHSSSGEEQQQLKIIAKAFQILSDPNKRIQYDREGIIDDNEEYSGLDVENLGGIGRVFGAMISRMGVPLPTQVSKDVLQSASQICSNGGIIGHGAPLDERVTDLVWGWSVDGRVARQDANFYRITVDEIKSKNGFIIFCRSLTGKFKLVIFDSNGEVIHIDESIRSRDGSQWESAFYFLTAFSMYRLPPSLPPSIREQDLPPVFNSLDTFTQCNMSLPPGQYLVCVYGDNFIGKTSYSLLAVPTLNDCQEAEIVQELDTALLNTKESLNKFQSEYLQAKENYERALKRVQLETERVEELIEKREYSYGAFMIASANAFLPNSTGGISPSHSKHIDNDAGILSDETRTALNQTVYQVANTVVSAGGWMTSTLTSGLGTLNRLIVGDTQPTETSFASSSTAKGAMKHEVDLLDDDDNDNDLPENRSPRLQLSDREDDRPVEYGEHEEDDEEEQEDSGDEYRMIGGSSSTHNLI